MHNRNKIIIYIPNSLSIMRFVLSIGLLIMNPFHISFWMLYSICGGSDIADGYIARKCNVTSEKGAVLDTLGDVLLIVVLLRILLVYTSLPLWSLLWILGITVLKLTTISVCYLKFKAYASLHTYANKAVGFLLFIGIPIYVVWGFLIIIILLLMMATVAAIEEIVLIMKSNHLQRNHKGILFTKKE